MLLPAMNFHSSIFMNVGWKNLGIMNANRKIQLIFQYQFMQLAISFRISAEFLNRYNFQTPNFQQNNSPVQPLTLLLLLFSASPQLVNLSQYSTKIPSHFIQVIIQMLRAANSCAGTTRRTDYQTTESRGPFRIEKTSQNLFEKDASVSKWRIRENAKYGAFLLMNKKEMEGRPWKQLWPYFESMAKFIKTRNLCQCKTQHKRLYNRFLSISGILEYLGQLPLFSDYLKEQLQILKSQNQIVSTAVILPDSVKVKQQEDKLQPTRDSYESKPPLIPESLKPICPIPFHPETKFPSAQFPAPNYFESTMPRMGTQRDFFTQINSRPNSAYQIELMECHHYFMRWMTKLSQLMNF